MFRLAIQFDDETGRTALAIRSRYFGKLRWESPPIRKCGPTLPPEPREEIVTEGEAA